MGHDWWLKSVYCFNHYVPLALVVEINVGAMIKKINQIELGMDEDGVIHYRQKEVKKVFKSKDNSIKEIVKEPGDWMKIDWNFPVFADEIIY
jgi:hypothetical protein